MRDRIHVYLNEYVLLCNVIVQALVIFRTKGRTNGHTDKRTDGRSDYIMPQILFGGIIKVKIRVPPWHDQK